MEVPLSPLTVREPVSALTPLVTSLFGVYVTLLFWRLCRGDLTKRLSLACFGVSMVVLYAASGLYHAADLPPGSLGLEVFRRLDHSAIYLLIAGTYTPVFAVVLTGRRRAFFLALVWLLAGAGTATKWLFPLTSFAVTAGLYLALGGAGLLPVVELTRAAGRRGLAWGLGGGLFYAAAAVLELARWPVVLPGVVAWHEVGHLFDMAGTGTHVGMMLLFVVPYRRAEPGAIRVARTRRMTRRVAVQAA
jgi:hemolysin III